MASMRLDLAQQVVRSRLHPAQLQDVLRRRRPVRQGLSLSDLLARLDPELPSLRKDVRDLLPLVRLDEDDGCGAYRPAATGSRSGGPAVARTAVAQLRARSSSPSSIGPSDPAVESLIPGLWRRYRRWHWDNSDA